MAEELEIKVKADTGEAVANLGKAEKAVDGVKKETVELDKTAGAASKSVDTAGKSAQKSAQEVAKLGEATGSTRGMFKGLSEMGGELGQKFGILAGKVMAVASAFTVGFQAGLKMREGLVALGVAVPDLSDKMANLVLRTEELVRGYEKAELVESAAIARGRQIVALREAQAVAERALAAAQAAACVEWKNADAERQKVIDKLNAVEQLLARANKGEAEYGATIKANAPLLRELAEASEANNIALEKVAPRTAAAAEAAEKYAAAATKVAEVQRTGRAVTIATAEAVLEEAAAWEGSLAALEADANKRRDHTTAVEAAERAQQDFGTSLDVVAQKIVETGGTMTVGAPYFIQYAQATREATQALLDMAVAHKGLREEQAQALEATKGWTDYILTLKDGYESGTTSLYNYVTALGAFKTQLLQMFAGAKGEAKESLQAIIDLINELVRTAGAGGRETFSQGPLGDLERAIRDANRNRGR